MVIFNGNQTNAMKQKTKYQSIFPSQESLGNSSLRGLQEALNQYFNTSNDLRSMELQYHAAGINGNVEDIIHVIDHQFEVRELYVKVAVELAKVNGLLNPHLTEDGYAGSTKNDAEWAYDEALKLNTLKK